MNYLVTAIGSMSAEAVIASLRGLVDARVVGCSCHPAAWTPASALVDAFYMIPSARETSDFIARLIEVCTRERIQRIIPLTDPEVDVLIDMRAFLVEQGIELCLPSVEATKKCRDKWRVYETFVNDPQVTVLDTWQLNADLPKPHTFPFIAKPRTGRSSEGIITIDDHADYVHWSRKLEGKGYIVQPKLLGEIFVFDVVRHQHDQSCVALGRAELLRTPNGAGLTVQMLRNSSLVETVCHIAERLDINGCVNIEFLIHEARPMLMDINPRFSAGVVFSQLAGYDMVANHLRCFGNESIDAQIEPTQAIYARRFAEVIMTKAEP